MDRIIILGAGALGSRHLQALALIAESITIDVYDLQQSSLDLAKERFEQMQPAESTLVNYLQDSSNISDNYKLAIIATNSKVRLQVLESLLSRASVEFLILEKFLFPSLDDYQKAQQLLNNHGVTSWVNCSRRMFEVYRQIRTETIDQQPVNIQVFAGDIGLGSNAIHFLDLLAFLTDNEEMTISLDLDPDIQESKRPGYIEFSGIVRAENSSGRLEVLAVPQANQPTIITIQSPEGHYVVQETTEMQVVKAFKKDGWQATFDIAPLPFQSKLTSGIWQQLIATKDCQLPTYQTASRLHKNFLQAIIDKHQGKQGITSNYCPIS